MSKVKKEKALDNYQSLQRMAQSTAQMYLDFLVTKVSSPQQITLEDIINVAKGNIDKFINQYKESQENSSLCVLAQLADTPTPPKDNMSIESKVQKYREDFLSGAPIVTYDVFELFKHLSIVDNKIVINH